MTWIGAVSQNMTGAAIGRRLQSAASATLRGNLRTAQQDQGYRFKIHPAETAQGLTEADLTFGFDTGDVRRYHAVGDGVTDDLAAFAKWAKMLAYFDGLIVHTDGGYLLSSNVVLPPGARIQGAGYRPLIFSNAAGKEIFSCTGTNVEELIIEGLRLQGHDAATVPVNLYGGFAAADTGLVTAAKLGMVRLSNIQASTFYNPIAALGTSNVKIDGCRATSFLSTGVMVANCSEFDVSHNVIDNCTQAGGVVAYGVQCTGDIEGGVYPSNQNCISFNKISGIPSWDGIGTHDVDGLTIIGNDIRGVRSGIDLGHLQATNIVSNLTVIGNYIEGTQTDTWAGASASHGGILIVGFDATHRVGAAVVVGNTVKRFFTVAGLTAGGFPGNISIVNSDSVMVSGNLVTDAGNIAGSRAVYMHGTCHDVVVTGNEFDGDFSGAVVRIDAVTSDCVSIRGNVSFQSTPANGGIAVTGSSIAAFDCGANPTNATPAYSDDTSTGGSVINPIGGGQRATFTATLTGCTTAPTATVIYQVHGDLVTLELPALTATSNTAAATLTGLPSAIQPVNPQVCTGVTIDQSTANISTLEVQAAGGTITLFKGANGAFSAAGTKGIGACTITYRRAA